MSGFEVVGVVLGGIPLIISALEHYADGVTTIKHMIEFENTFLDSQSRLLLSLAIFQQSCRELVQDLPDSQVRDLMDLRNGWDDPELKIILARKLGKDFEVYRMSVKLLNKRIGLLRKKLKLREDLTAPFIVGGVVDEKLRKDFFKSSWSRIRGGFQAEKHKQLVNEIRDDVDQLCTFTKGAMDIEDLSHERSASAISSYWLGMRSHTHGLYNALRSIWSHNCSSHTHLARLALDLPNDLEDERDTPRFSLYFSLAEKTSTQTSLPGGSRNFTVLSFQSPVPSTSPNVVSKSPNAKKKTQFNLPTSPTHGRRKTKMACTSQIKIENLCTTIGKICQPGSCCGFLSGQDWHYHIHDAVDQKVKGLTPLPHILHCQDSTRTTTRQKRTLALALASGVLQLYNTPWLRDRWTADDIYVDTTAHQLYVVKTFDPTAVDQQHISTSDDELLVKNRTLFALGVALLELTYGAPLSTLQTPEDLNDAFTQYRAATRLTKKMQADELPRFASAVGKCIYPTAEGCDFSFGNEAFRRRFFEEVVLPLKEDYEELFPKSSRTN
ncbi:hypothetical protein BT63DRAFT_422895 [Microthyrium microscopicum]|uniref:DUF7580 domain-containing protein n=1 Tax=Microthyrium microscopicum TaxID=703497 RepID=A0A6A6ULV9_9PEZI|nr:hypothetical protein BT63DRAFT_422895 [Microthyrium microscopicum]